MGIEFEWAGYKHIQGYPECENNEEHDNEFSDAAEVDHLIGKALPWVMVLLDGCRRWLMISLSISLLSIVGILNRTVIVLEFV